MLTRDYNQFEVTVVGAGPAGSVLGYLLAKRGIKVLILEKYHLPRPKVCAGGITVRAASLLPFDFKETVEDVVYGARLSYRLSPKRVRKYDKPLAYMVRREKFDRLLAEKACEAGAVLEDGTEVLEIKPEAGEVLVTTGQIVFATPVLVGADGANSVVVKSLGMRSKFSFGLGLNGHIAVSADQSRMWKGLIGLDWGIPGGYAWVFPKKDCVAIGAGSSFHEAKKLRPYTLDIIRKYGLGTLDGQIVRGQLMPVRKSGTPVSNGRVALVGDAAGMIDPLSGEGIYYALRSAYLAADAINGFLAGKSADLKSYDTAVIRELGPELKIARTIQKMNSAVPQVFFHYLTESDRFWRAFCQMLRGERTYVGLKKRLPWPVRILFKIM